MQPDKIKQKPFSKCYGHNKEILLICLNKQCESSRLCCLTCVDEFHCKHELISLFKFQQLLIESDEKLKNNDKNDIFNIIKQSEVQFHNQLDKSFEKAFQEYHHTKNQLNNIFQKAYAMVNFQNQKVQKTLVKEFYCKFDSKAVNQCLEKIASSKNKSYETTQTTLAMIKNSELILQDQIKDFQNGFSKLMQQFAQSINQIKTILTQSTFTPYSKKFSKINKAQCLQVDESEMTTKRIQGSGIAFILYQLGGYPINLLEQPITKENNKISIKITEQPGNKGIWMGVAILDIVKSNNFLNCFGTDKGTYAIDQVSAAQTSAFSWNHHDYDFNGQPKVGWQFYLGDTVNIKVDFSIGNVTFTRGKDHYTQPIRLDLGNIYFFAGPTNLGDALRVI